VAALIAAQREQHRVPHAAACRALGVSRSWFYKWKDGTLTARAARRAALAAEVRRLFKAHRGSYGSPRITADLRAAGWRVSENTVAALMREQGLAARRKKKRRATTRPGKGRWRAPDLVKRDFPAKQVNRKWYGDGTEIPTGQGKLYLLVTWNHPGVSSWSARPSAVASLQVDGDGSLAADVCSLGLGQMACPGAA
jgi:putative transposase